jgi:hypothetical protein
MSTLDQMLAELAEVRQAISIANRAVICDIESEGHLVVEDGIRYYDVRPMTDPREHGPENVDMATEAITYAVSAGLVVAHPDPERPWLVRVVHGAAREQAPIAHHTA